MAFKGIGVLHIRDGRYSVSDLMTLTVKRGWVADSNNSETLLNYHAEKDHGDDGFPKYAYGRDGVIFPIYETNAKYHLATDRFADQYISLGRPTLTMVRKWEEFKEYSENSGCSFKEYLDTLKGAKASLTPRFKIQCLMLFVEDQGCLYGCFNFVGGGYVADSVKQSVFMTDDHEWNCIYRYCGPEGWRDLPKICDESFSLIAVHYDSGYNSWEDVFEKEKWRNVYSAKNKAGNTIGDYLDSGVFPPHNLSDETFEYDGQSHKPEVKDSSDYSVRFEPDGEWCNVGEYRVIVTLKPGKRWQGGKKDERKAVIKIIPKRNEWLKGPSIDKDAWEDGDAPGDIKAEAKYGEVKIEYDDSRESQKPTSVGRHIAYVSVEGVGECDGLSAVPLEFEIKQCELGNEITFLRMFKKYVQGCGFNYTDRDLVRFHTCVKTGMMTLLGGDPGSGKSSLFELYARALAGNSEGGNFKRIDVNPAWMEPSDLMGYCTPNITDQNGASQFHESQCKLREFLVGLKEHEQKRAPALVCFEEMNLARIELYFAEFIQFVSRYRIDQDKKLDSYGGNNGQDELKLPRDIRFVGTFNDDVTVKPMSDRFLDRSSVIRLSVDDKNWNNSKGESQGEFRLFARSSGRITDRPGPMVSASDYEKWIKIPTLEDVEKIGAELDEIISKIKGELSEIVACPSPRAVEEMLRYVVNRPFDSDVPVDVQRCIALDEALVQRVISKCVPNALMRGKFLKAAERINEVFSSVGMESTSLTVNQLEKLEKETSSLFQWGGVTDVDYTE